MVIRDGEGKKVIYHYDSEEQRRYEAVLEILFETDRKRLERLLDKKREKEQRIDDQIEENHKKRFLKISKKENKKYNLTQTSRILKVHRQTLYYWIKKKWIKPKRDFKGYPVFTVLDIERLIEWKNTLKTDNFKKMQNYT